MDGRGRALDNVFIERLWRSLKYELIYPGDFANLAANCFRRLEDYFHFYNHQRPHQALGYQTAESMDLFPHRQQRKRSFLITGNLAPKTPGIYRLFSSRMDVFLFTGTESCRTIEMLDRRG